jgi:type I restriction enzyme M protein
MSAHKGYIQTVTYTVKQPFGGEEMTHSSPEEIMDEIAALDAESAEVLRKIRELLAIGAEAGDE